MTTFLTWNLNKKNTVYLHKVLLEIVKENNIDVLILQEAYGQAINTLVTPIFDEINYPGTGVGSGVRIFLKAKKYKQFAVERTKNKKLVFIHLEDNVTKSQFNIAAVHLHSKVGNSGRQQLWKNLPLIENIKEYEKTITNNTNTILVGDFNHNPFEDNLCDPNLISGIESKQIITTLAKYPVTKKEFDFWYNPMWNLMGDYDFRTKGHRTSGTYFRYTEDESPIWNLYDGFLLRPSLMDSVNYDLSEIITKTKSENFLKPFIIAKHESLIKEDLSDHLPIKFTLN